MKANEKYLLYIDILGFSNLVNENSSKLQELFNILDSLNVHMHDAFKTIVFSDTILVFNKHTPINQHDHEYCIMYACEFVQDLFLRSVSLGIHFRAILTYGEFQYEKMKNIEAYHGKSLVGAYNKEKEIDGMGLFIDKALVSYCRFFSTASFDLDLNFVFLTKTLESICFTYDLDFPFDKSMVDGTDEFYNFPKEVKYLQTLKENIDKQTDPKIKGKYLRTYNFYKTRYSKHLSELEEANFDFKILSPSADWKIK